MAETPSVRFAISCRFGFCRQSVLAELLRGNSVPRSQFNELLDSFIPKHSAFAPAKMATRTKIVGTTMNPADDAPRQAINAIAVTKQKRSISGWHAIFGLGFFNRSWIKFGAKCVPRRFPSQSSDKCGIVYLETVPFPFMPTVSGVSFTFPVFYGIYIYMAVSSTNN